MKTSFTLTKDSWHMRLMSYIWGYQTRDFTHMCPYFWLSVINLFIIVPIFLFRNIVGPILIGIDKANKYFEKQEEKEYEKMVERLKTNPNTLDKILMSCDRKFEGFLSKISKKQYDHKISREEQDYYSNLWSDIYMRREALRRERASSEYEKQKLQMQASIVRKQKINATLKTYQPVIKYISYVLIAVIGLVLLWFIYWLFTMMLLIPSGFWIGLIMGVIGVALFLGFVVLLANGLQKMFSNVGCIKMSWLNPIGKFFLAIRSGIVSGVDFIVMMIKDNCPPIDWVDKE